jgi:hypothetical protein
MGFAHPRLASWLGKREPGNESIVLHDERRNDGEYHRAAMIVA